MRDGGCDKQRCPGGRSGGTGKVSGPVGRRQRQPLVSNSAIQRQADKGACGLGQGAGSVGHEILKSLGQ